MQSATATLTRVVAAEVCLLQVHSLLLYTLCLPVYDWTDLANMHGVYTFALVYNMKGSCPMMLQASTILILHVTQAHSSNAAAGNIAMPRQRMAARKRSNTATAQHTLDAADKIIFSAKKQDGVSKKASPMLSPGPVR